VKVLAILLNIMVKTSMRIQRGADEKDYCAKNVIVVPSIHS